MQNKAYKNSEIYYYSCARHAFKASLEILKLKERDIILLPGFICRDLLSSINELNLRYKFYEVDRNLQPKSFPSHPNIKVVLAVNFFGFPSPLKKFHEYCSKIGSILIEDNAHGYLSHDENGNELGMRASLGFTSLRKIIPVYDGAILYINNNNGYLKPDVIKPIKSNLPIRFIIKNTSRYLEKRLHLPISSYLEDLSRLIRYVLTGNVIPKPHPYAEERIGKIKNIHASSLRDLKKFEKIRVDEQKRRRNLFSKFSKLLNNHNIEPIFNQLPEYTSPYGFPFIATNHNAKLVMKIARKYRLTCVKWPDLPKEIEFSCPNFYKEIYFIDFLI